MTSGILIIVRYYLVIGVVELVALIEFSYLLLEVLSPRNDIKGAIGSILLIALLRRLFRVLERLELLAYYTPEGVSYIKENLGRILLIY